MRGEIKKLSEEGFGIIKAGKKKIYVPFTAVGDIVEIKKWHREKKKLVAHEYEIIMPSPIRTEPKCPYFGKCGGCMLQHLPYDEQIKFKAEKLENLFGYAVDVIPSPKIYGHRNRIDVVISTEGIGFRRRGTWWDVVDIEECIVFGEKSGRALKSLREFIEDFKLQPWDLRKSEGFMRYIVMREGKFTGELMINLVTYEGSLPDEVQEYFSFADSIYWSVNSSKSDVSYGEPRKFWNKEFIKERLDDVVYLIHPNSFFQTNSYQAVNLVKKVAEFAEGRRVLDLYSGVGTFGIYLAKKGFEVEGIEINPFAVEMARKNAEINSANATFYVGEDRNVENLGKYDTVVVDPPRAGLHPKLIRKMLKDAPETIVYVSCNPKTLAKNLEELKSIYKVEEIIGLDMFPHTSHVEVVTKLKLNV
ncbi:23S rRNA (uracil(1939)-C(5))-methyltransferase RlmD [Thermococcus sp. SY098]|uniref:23S rRNA (uracil(1939)-C(5))-methyltransferase RlmD n=1 Tax=Thermococcus sp. SY098 TaxID=3111325 RepID=UPI002D766B16|nr:23S rRNA (uracil(1939)-C(5))-methyltransferase RlmD [Thermococcus sp. SY098]WRS52001.1 23S rRNA (uracil(1939)-C(5))-methyltransferase RlmD [Thermococcus sp. SY098]